MKVEKAIVDYRRETEQSQYKVTIYIGLQVDSGPDFQVLLTSLQQLYRIFMTYEKSESYKMAEFCLRNGYNVLAQRVNKISGKSSCRKFIQPTETVPLNYFFSPREDVDYSVQKNLTFDSGFNTSQGEINPLCSVIIKYLPGDFKDNQINDYFKLMVPVLLKDEETRQTRFALNWFLGSKVSVNDLQHDVFYQMDEGVSLDYNDFRKELNKFLVEYCGFEVEEYGEYSYVRSDTMIQCFSQTDLTVNGQEIISITPSDIGMNDNYCYYYNDYKVCTIYSKYDDSINDISVTITKSSEYYYVTVYKTNSLGAVIYTEIFNYSTDPSSVNFISNLSRDSLIVDIVINDEKADLSGVYNLKGRTNLITENDYVNSLTPLEDEDQEVTFNADVCLDMSTYNQLSYIRLLKSAFPNSLIFTDYGQLLQDEMDRVVPINPKVIWNDTNEEMKGFSLLIYSMKTESNMSDSSMLKVLPIDESQYNNSFFIEHTDYDVELMGVNVSVSSNSSRFPIRTSLAIVAIENFVVTSSYTNEYEFIEVLKQSNRNVNSFLGTNVRVEPVDISVVSRRLKAILNFYVDNMIISSYRIVATILE